METPTNRQKSHTMTSPSVDEPERRTPVVGEYDVIVAGGGPAGLAAAVAAARLGAKTKLIEQAGCLGGVWTSGLLSWVLDSENKTGLMAQIRRTLSDHGQARFKNRGFTYDPEHMKAFVEALCLSTGVDIRLHTQICDVISNDQGALDAVITESKSGREAWRAQVFIDATGDGDLGARAGCSFEVGRPGTGEVQPMTLVALVCGVPPEAIRPFIGGGSKPAKAALFEEFRRAGITPSYASPTLFYIRDDLYALSANHEYGVQAMDADGITRATLHAREELNQLVAALQKLGGPWTGLRLLATAPQIGVREGRRLKGLYTITGDDIVAGQRHDDAICECGFGIDVHSTNPSTSADYSTENKTPAKPYDIPLRALIAADVDRLLLAGRCISGDFLAHASYRVTGNAIAMGEAAGVLAAVATRRGTSPREVPWKEFMGARDELLTTA